MRPRSACAWCADSTAPDPASLVRLRVLAAAVFAAYGWPADLPDEEILARLVALNLERPPA